MGPQYDPRFAGGGFNPTMPVQPNWNLAMAPGAAAQWFAPPPPDVAKQNREAMAADAESAAAAKAAAAGIQNQKDEELTDAMSNRYRLAPEDERIRRQLKTADSIRALGHSLNTGSVNGSAPNWAGALADVAGGYLAGKERRAAEASAKELGGQYADIASKYFGARPKDSWF